MLVHAFVCVHEKKRVKIGKKLQKINILFFFVCYWTRFCRSSNRCICRFKAVCYFSMYIHMYVQYFTLFICNSRLFCFCFCCLLCQRSSFAFVLFWFALLSVINFALRCAQASKRSRYWPSIVVFHLPS